MSVGWRGRAAAAALAPLSLNSPFALASPARREFLFSSIPFLSFTGLLNIFYFSAPFLSCVLENYSPTENLQVLCEDLDISTAPITLLINTVVFYAVFDVPLSPFFGYTRTTFHTFKMLLHHQIITAIVFGTTLLCCWTYSSVRQQATVEEYEQFAREQSLKGRDFRWWSVRERQTPALLICARFAKNQQTVPPPPLLLASQQIQTAPPPFANFLLVQVQHLPAGAPWCGDHDRAHRQHGSSRSQADEAVLPAVLPRDFAGDEHRPDIQDRELLLLGRVLFVPGRVLGQRDVPRTQFRHESPQHPGPAHRAHRVPNRAFCVR